jgi:hypothetical protein
MCRVTLFTSNLLCDCLVASDVIPLRLYPRRCRHTCLTPFACSNFHHRRLTSAKLACLRHPHSHQPQPHRPRSSTLHRSQSAAKARPGQHQAQPWEGAIRCGFLFLEFDADFFCSPARDVESVKMQNFGNIVPDFDAVLISIVAAGFCF